MNVRQMSFSLGRNNDVDRIGFRADEVVVAASVFGEECATIGIALEDPGDHIFERDWACPSFCVAYTELLAGVFVNDLYGVPDCLGAPDLCVRNLDDVAVVSLSVLNAKWSWGVRRRWAGGGSAAW